MCAASQANTEGMYGRSVRLEPLGGGRELERWASMIRDIAGAIGARKIANRHALVPGENALAIVYLSFIRFWKVTRVIREVVRECGLAFDRRRVVGIVVRGWTFRTFSLCRLLKRISSVCCPGVYYVRFYYLVKSGGVLHISTKVREHTIFFAVVCKVYV